ncbi:MAG TPA: hypothetical protein VGQ94_02950, partial [Terriglobales bacterium]|nr:hypothetical protein [Terriglobales bacterium]
AAAFLCLAVVIAQASRYRHERTVRGWEPLLSRRMRTSIQSLELGAEVDAAMADGSFHAALRARHDQQLERATRLLGLSFRAIEEATPDRLKRLRAAAVLIRMAAAIVPVRPLRIRGYKLAEISALVGVGAALHHVVVSALERFLLRTQVIGIGLRLTCRAMAGSRSEAAAAPAAERPWALYERALADWKSLDREHVETYKALVRSLAG